MSENSLKSTKRSRHHNLRTGLIVEDIKHAFLDNLLYSMDRVPGIATKNELYTALAMTVRDRGSRV